MSVQICKALDQGNEQVKADVQRIAGVYEAEGWLPKSPQELTSRLLYVLSFISQPRVIY
jgi:NAD+ synthase (glutamine-hydrolysing)